MLLLIVDTETTGISEDKEVSEIAATLYRVADNSEKSPERATGAIASVSVLLPFGNGGNNEDRLIAEKINGITSELSRALSLDKSGETRHRPRESSSLDLASELVTSIEKLASLADYCVAFNAEFDKPLLTYLTHDTPWLCALKDFRWGYPSTNKYGSFSLVDLALWLGIGVSTAHRAGDDVRLLVECFNRKKEHGMLQAMVAQAINRSLSPLIELEALVSYSNKDLAKQAGFSWDDKPGHKGWFKVLKQCDLHEFLGDDGEERLGFAIVQREIE